ncbi:MAG: response regulator transcription factor [Gammaproteobacteria bacterium]|nr:response regulator transcription factor [Gammaproteobacteria bacterium]
MNPIQLFVYAQLDIFLDGLLRILEDCNDISVYHCESEIQVALQQVKEKQPDVILLHSQLLSAPFDLFFSQFSSTVTDKELKTLVFGQSLNDDFLLKIIHSGAHGYINSNMSAKHLVQAVKYVSQGNVWIERHILEELAQNALHMERVLEQIALEKTRVISELLTRREAQVFQWVLKGLSTKEISGEIHLSEQSVKLHLGKLFKKFEVTNRPQLLLSIFERASPVDNIIPLIQAALEKKHHQ